MYTFRLLYTPSSFHSCLHLTSSRINQQELVTNIHFFHHNAQQSQIFNTYAPKRMISKNDKWTLLSSGDIAFPPCPGFLQNARRATKNPKYHFVKTSKQPPRESRGRSRDGDGTKTWDSREPSGMQDESRWPFFSDTLPPATGCRADGRRPRVSRTGKKARKKTDGFCTRTASNQKEKAVRSPAFSRFPRSRKFLCGKKFSSLRQERNFFQQRNSVFAARKRPPRRRNAPYGQFSRPFFNTSGSISALPSRRTDADRGGKPSILTGKPKI